MSLMLSFCLHEKDDDEIHLWKIVDDFTKAQGLPEYRQRPWHPLKGFGYPATSILEYSKFTTRRLPAGASARDCVNHTSLITGSEFEIILPFNFTEPVNPFAERKPADYGLDWEFFFYRIRAAKQQIPRYFSFFYGTPWQKVYILSAVKIHDEARTFLEYCSNPSKAKKLSKLNKRSNEDVDTVQFGAKHLHEATGEAIKSRVALRWSG